MAWFNATLSAVSLGLGLLHLVRLATARRDGRSIPGEASHAVMGLGMAAMFSPVGDPVPAPVWIALFGLSASWFAASALRSGLAVDDAGHHVVCGVAMLFMLAVGMQGGGASTGGAHSHHGGAATAAGPAGWTSLVAIVLAGYFAWHVMRCGDRFAAARRARTAAPEPALAGVATGPAAGSAAHTGMVDMSSCAHEGAVVVEGRLGALRTAHTAAVAHLVMAATMAVMLLGMI